MIYLDYAATSPLRREALDEMLPYLTQRFGNPDSAHAMGRAAAYAVTKARDQIASLLGVKPKEVYFTSGGTEADNWAVRYLGTGKALVSELEHAAVLSSAPLREGGFEKIGASFDGLVQTKFDCPKGIGLVCVMAVNNETGCIQPVEEISRRAHDAGALFFSDCVQAACTQDLKKILSFSDAISISAHKIGGPKGIGALIVKNKAAIKPLIAGGEQERSLRGGTLNVAGIVGFARALELAIKEREEFLVHTARCRDLFEEEIFAAVKSKVVRDGKDRAPNISHLTFEKGEALLNALDLRGVAASGGAACSAHAKAPSHVLVAMGRSREEAARGVRFSFSLKTAETEALDAAKTVISILKENE